ncbi:tubulin-specific chaperone D-like [Orbicella faveolata]|uniref:tubulin-specific chaperone D-like n=1 Tax=Orbicella faveolata TaxID=48498 RepID=UPI0009E5AD09|nr:tubulin-specific chaperone D-like [Orbicella faveolata]
MLYNRYFVSIVLTFSIVLAILQVISGLISASELSNDPGKYAESRRDALKSLASIACSVGLSRTGDEERVVTERSLQQLYDAFIAAMNDYTIDSRGDVGAWVREASMTGLETLSRFVVETIWMFANGNSRR